MTKYFKSDIVDIVKKANHITLDATAYSSSDIKDIAKVCKDSNCNITLKNANHLSKSELLSLLAINCNIEIEISNPENTSSKDIAFLKKEHIEQKKILSEIKKAVENISRHLNSRR